MSIRDIGLCPLCGETLFVLGESDLTQGCECGRGATIDRAKARDLVTAFVLAAYAANINPLPVLRKQHRTARYICDEKEAVVLRRDEWRIDIYRDDEIVAVVVVSDPTAGV